MNFNKHSELGSNQHAFLAASKHSWLNYTDDKLRESYFKSKSAEIGTILHKLVEDCVSYSIGIDDCDSRLVKYVLLKAGIDPCFVDLDRYFETITRFVKDAIGYRMQVEQKLYYSPFCWGTADAICYSNGVLRIHDLKTGETPPSMDQLKIYAGLFCLEYNIKPSKCKKIILHIYQQSGDDELICPASEIEAIMDKIVHANEVLKQFSERIL